MPVLSPVSLNPVGSGSNAISPTPRSPMVVVAASESHSIRSKSYISGLSLSRSKSGSMSVTTMSEPIMYVDLSVCSTPSVRSNLAESTAVMSLPDGLIGSAYSARRMSSDRIQCLPSADSPNLSSIKESLTAGHEESAGPSVNLMFKSISNMPASGATSEMGPSSGASVLSVPMMPGLAVWPPAVASTTESLPRNTRIVTGPRSPCAI